MGITASKVYEYVLECDKCGIMEVYHTGDLDRGVFVHSLSTAKRAASFHKCGSKTLCHICYEGYLLDKRKKGY